MAEQDWLVGGHGFSLTLEAIVGVAAVNDPLSVEGVASVQGSFLVAADGGEDDVGLGGATQVEHFLVEVLVGTNLDFLTETDHVVSSENVR